MRSLAQAPKAPRRIAILIPGTRAGYQSRIDAFRADLKNLGHIEGRDISFEERWTDDQTERLASLAAELVALGPAVILTASSAGVAACKKAISTIPIVFATAGAPVEQGFASSLRRPGGNITGILVHLGVAAKIVEVTREAFPKAQRLAILVHESDPVQKLILETFLPSARRFNFKPVVVRVKQAEDIGRAFNDMANQKADALYLPNFAFSVSHSDQLIDHSLKARLPLLSTNLFMTAKGGLLSYGTPAEENYRRAAALVDKILRGAKPGELAIEQPERFQLVVNMKTAKAIGVKLSPAIMLRVTEVIE
jgi:putative ABC transport system substrate-binding protein